MANKRTQSRGRSRSIGGEGTPLVAMVCGVRVVRQAGGVTIGPDCEEHTPLGPVAHDVQ